MSILRTRGAQGIQNEGLPNSVGQVFFGADNSRDAHEGIIYGHTKVVNRDSIRSQKDKISNSRVSVPSNSFTDDILNHNPSALGNLESHGERSPYVQHLVDFFLWSVTPTSIITRRNTRRLLLCLHFLQLFRGAKAPVRFTF
jgi:hypothetical protein